ncbi:S24 family peptidase [Paracidovorax citrulli]|uniref:S24 family peptidase n=2 Tax=Paracidovorax citrulli TaxID=80869 RepID=UPI00336AACA5
MTGETKTIEGANLVSAAAFLGVSPMWLAKGIGPMRPDTAPPEDDDDFQDVMRVDVRLAGGDGALAGLEEAIGNLKFAGSFLRACKVSPSKARVVDVRGHSMHPTIPDGAVVLIDVGSREPEHNGIFALARPVEGLIVKRLKKTDDGWVAFSDNPVNKPIPINDGEPMKIIGKAVWMGVTL